MQAAKWLVSPLLAATGLLKPKTPKLPSPMRPATRDDARAVTDAQDELRRRKGGAADIVTGSLGAEAPAGGKVTLGS